MKRGLIVLFAGILLCGCRVSNKPYHTAKNSIIAIPHETGAASPDCNPGTEAGSKACLAFIEFDDMGEMWYPGQLTEAVNLIKKAKGNSSTPIVITFVHGWKNNAEEQRDGTGNVAAFEAVLQNLKRGQYRDFPIVGIYVGWRGDLVSKYWPVSRQLTLFNREAAAIRIPGTSMTGALTRIMQVTHQNGPDAQLIMIGHSFGGLILERALSQAMTDYILRQSTSGTPGSDGSRSWADLVVFVNSAAAASEGKQMIDLLMREHFQLLKQGQKWPLFVSISSLGDAATRFGLPIGHGPGYLDMAIHGSWRKYEDPQPHSVKSQSSYYLSTTAHMEALQSHIIVDVTKELAGRPCEQTPGSVFASYQAPGGETISRKPFGQPFPTTTGQCYQIFEKPQAWNTSAYWAMQMPATIVPDHSGIFNQNFVRLLENFFLTAKEMNERNLRQKLMRSPESGAANNVSSPAGTSEWMQPSK